MDEHCDGVALYAPPDGLPHGMLVERAQDEDGVTFWGCAPMCVSEGQFYIGEQALMICTKQGRLIDPPHEIDVPYTRLSVPKSIIQYMPNQIGLSYMPMMMESLKWLHEKSEVELVEHRRGARRRVERQTGKTPSPYFTIVRPGHRKGYTGRMKAHSATTREEHTVRGHFRNVFGHPFIPDGVYFIEPHQRGGQGDKSETHKRYKIVPPKAGVK